MKGSRNAKGQLTISLEEIKKKNIVEASDYYKPGSIYLKCCGRERICFICFRLPGDGETGTLPGAFDGYGLFIRWMVWALLFPDVASDGRELLFVE